MKKRGSGILLHITSLPSQYGIGDLGPCAYKFVDFLHETKQSYWQILPMNPTDPFYDNSPYHSISAFALNPLFISFDLLVKEGFLESSDLEPVPHFPCVEVDFLQVIDYKKKRFHLAFERFMKKKNRYEFNKFCNEHSPWLDDFALFTVLKAESGGKAWIDWPQELRDRQPEALSRARENLQTSIEKVKFLQYILIQQWLSLKRYCNQKGIHIIGDIPIYIDYDSVDLWAHQEIFKLDENKRPYVVAGVPPDYFSETGQLWGNPLYRWDTLKANGFDWWVKRVIHNLQLFDIIRIDHFRGLVAYWEIPATEKTAINGKWIEAPAIDFFNTLINIDPFLPIIAEDLGLITPDVREIIKKFEFPGMKVLLFAFGEDIATNPYIPHNVEKNSIIYTGTHDNNTVKGWFEIEATHANKKRFFDYIGREVSAESLPSEMIRLAMMSIANTAIIPLQDILGLGAESRMNIPATNKGNWRWRYSTEQLHNLHAEKLLKMTEMYGRS